MSHEPKSIKYIIYRLSLMNIVNVFFYSSENVSAHKNVEAVTADCSFANNLINKKIQQIIAQEIDKMYRFKIVYKLVFIKIDNNN